MRSTPRVATGAISRRPSLLPSVFVVGGDCPRPQSSRPSGPPHFESTTVYMSILHPRRIFLHGNAFQNITLDLCLFLFSLTLDVLQLPKTCHLYRSWSSPCVYNTGSGTRRTLPLRTTPRTLASQMARNTWDCPFFFFTRSRLYLRSLPARLRVRRRRTASLCEHLRDSARSQSECLVDSHSHSLSSFSTHRGMRLKQASMFHGFVFVFYLASFSYEQHVYITISS
jgi:hypothetical protein